MTVEVHPFQAGLGADISGVDIREPLSTADRDGIRKAWLDNLVLRFRGMQMIHAATHSSGGRAHKGFEQVEDVSKVPGARQPMVRTHPETGKKSLFLGRRINAYVIGLPVAASEALLDELWGHMVQDKFTWTQEWQVGDLVWWDNRCAMHRRDAFDPATRRLMHRTQLQGTRPV